MDLEARVSSWMAAHPSLQPGSLLKDKFSLPLLKLASTFSCARSVASQQIGNE